MGGNEKERAPGAPSNGGGASAHRVLLVCSAGGHLAQLHRLAPWWSQHERVWVTGSTADAATLLAGETTYGAYFPTTRSVKNLIRNFVLGWRVLRRHRPEVVVSNGAGIALPFFVLARLFGIRTVYVEVYDRVTSRTLTGRLCRPFSDLFLVQWPEQQRLYKGSVTIGTLY